MPKHYKTHCIDGHEFTPENSIYLKDGYRRCRECKRGNDAMYDKYKRKKRYRGSSPIGRGNGFKPHSVQDRGLPTAPIMGA
jgi:hypothetical protein